MLQGEYDRLLDYRMSKSGDDVMRGEIGSRKS